MIKNSSNATDAFSKQISARKNRQKGIVEIIVVVIIALVLIHLLGIDLKSLLSQEWVKNFAIYVRDLLKLVWADILQIVAFIKDISGSTATSTAPVK